MTDTHSTRPTRSLRQVRRRLRLSLALPILFALACGEPGVDADRDDPFADPATTEYAPELGVDLDEITRTESGLLYRDIVEGEGPIAESGRVVAVHYTGWLPDGTPFDSSRDRDQLFVFDLGAGHVIQGWDEGVEGMRVGGQRQLVIPPHLAYGEEGAGGVIPPNATLVFEVELFEVED